MKFKKKLKESSRQWISRHKKDIYTKNARDKGQISRSSYKLEEIHKKFDIFFQDAIIIDLGAAPGGWSQIAKTYSNSNNIIALDILEMKQIEGVHCIQGDFSEKVVVEQIEERLKGQKADIILSDMAPNTIGIKSIDHLRIMNLAELVLEFSLKNLAYNGWMIVKIFKGSDEQNLMSLLKKHFKKVSYFKPQSSRQESSEVYVIAQAYNAR